MTFDERIAVIVGGVTRVPGMEEGDREHVRREVEKLLEEREKSTWDNTLRHAARLICYECADHNVPERGGNRLTTFFHHGLKMCRASRILEVL